MLEVAKRCRALCAVAVLSATACNSVDDEVITFCSPSTYEADGGSQQSEEIVFVPEKNQIRGGDITHVYDVVVSDDVEGILGPFFLLVPRKQTFAEGVTSVALGDAKFDVTASVAGDIWLISSQGWMPDPTASNGTALRSSLLYSGHYGIVAFQNVWRLPSGGIVSENYIRCNGHEKSLFTF